MKNKTLNLIEKLAPVINKIKLVESFERFRQHYDEPKFWYYSATISDRYLKQDGNHFSSKASGVSFFSQKTAILKALAEAIERYSNFAFFKDTVDYIGSYSDLKKMALNPKEFVFFSDKQLQTKAYKRFLINDKSLFRWTKIKSLDNKKDYFIPSQLIYLSYKHVKGEPIIYPSISTGVAGHFTIEHALLNGIYEILERDAFMIYFLNKLRPKQYDLTSSENKKIKSFLDISKRYNLQIVSLSIKTDVDIPVVATIVIDRSGLAKAVSIGLKSHLDIEKAIIGSINEAFHTRTWIREAYIQNPKGISKSELINDSSIRNRGIFWYFPKSISKINFMIKNLEVIKVKNENEKLTVPDQISKLKKALDKKGYKIFYKNITPAYFKEIPYERYPLQGGKRLKKVPVGLGYKNNTKLNMYPHPFL